ncbi:hypothetical protein ACHAP1_008202 [Verticillium nonalfalfae]
MSNGNPKLADSITSVELNQTTSVTVRTQYIQLVAVICESYSADFAKDIDRLLVTERACIDNVDKVGLFRRNKYRRPVANWRKPQSANTGQL